MYARAAIRGATHGEGEGRSVGTVVQVTRRRDGTLYRSPGGALDLGKRRVGGRMVVSRDVRSPPLVDARSVHRGVTREDGGRRLVGTKAERERRDGTLSRYPGGALAQGLGRGGGMMVVPGDVRSLPLVDARSVHRGVTREEEGRVWWARSRRGCGGIGPFPDVLAARRLRAWVEGRGGWSSREMSGVHPS